MNFGNTLLSHGSAFFYRKNGDIYLITNWHNLSGRRPYNGKCIDRNGAVPNNVSLFFHADNQLGQYSSVQIPFQLESENGDPLWLQHPQHGQNIDIAVLKISIPENMCVYPVNEIPQTDDMRVDVGMDVFVLGFPIRLFTDILPIWKRATISTEYFFNVDGLSKFLIDTATQEGMSGSPVFLRARGSYATEAGDNIMCSTAVPTKFLGIYSGRYIGDNIENIQLGIVWKKELIDEIINNGVVGHPLF